MGGTETLAFDAVRRILRTKEEASRDTRGGVRCLRAGGTRASYVHERLALASVEVATREGPRATGRRHRFGDREPARFRETWTRPWSLTPQTRGAIFFWCSTRIDRRSRSIFSRAIETKTNGAEGAKRIKKKKSIDELVATKTKQRARMRKRVLLHKPRRVLRAAPRMCLDGILLRTC